MRPKYVRLLEGKRVRITDIGPRDAYSDTKDEWIGRVGIADHMNIQDNGWLWGHIAVGRDNSFIAFHQVKVEMLD
jgi:hypothetical protein